MIMDDTPHIRLLESEATPDPVEVPLEKDDTLLLSTVVAQYPDAVGVRFRGPTGSWRGLKCDGKLIHPPPQGWGNTNYYIVEETPSDLKRDAEEGPRVKFPKMEDGDSALQERFQRAIEEKWRKAHAQNTLITNTGTQQEGEVWNCRKKGQEKADHFRKIKQERENKKYQPVTANKQGFQIVYKAHLNDKPGREVLINEALQLLKRYYYQVCREQNVASTCYFENRKMENFDRDLIFIETDMNDPSQLSDAIFQDLLSFKCGKSIIDVLKKWKKFTPVGIICSSDHNDIVETTKKVVEPYLKGLTNPQMTAKFKLMVPGAENRVVYRLLKFKEFNEYLESKGAPADRWDNNSEMAIFVRLIDNLTFISLLKNYNKLNHYNLMELCDKIELKEGLLAQQGSSGRGAQQTEVKKKELIEMPQPTEMPRRSEMPRGEARQQGDKFVNRSQACVIS